ncbi:hypothetical protein TVAGG3_0003910 [Trichomonas vaginalis G3]|uniref:hypothetical protein n=1 Tax=Trichomonas vaginalis (strain ATCC PRA-98 / G3) TaxID=412133 RepID=UPI0021E5ACBE|nr:hypothetical protein TVAGG3_0003910 [Trichomonas vaginalis G3]KAI5538786.1 hypothetical protein TVAGG3_0003910 [Trichomonas vaginalis G3]
MSNRQRTTSSTRSSQASGTRNSQTPRSSQALYKTLLQHKLLQQLCPFKIRKGTCCNRANSSSSTGKRDSG